MGPLAYENYMSDIYKLKYTNAVSVYVIVSPEIRRLLDIVPVGGGGGCRHILYM